MRAAAGELDGQAVQTEAARGGLRAGAGGDLAAFDLRHLAAAGADQELAGVALFRLGAADIGVQGFQPMDQALGNKEIQRAIDCRRGRRTGAGARLQRLQDRIGADGLMLAPDDLRAPAVGWASAGRLGPRRRNWRGRGRPRCRGGGCGAASARRMPPGPGSSWWWLPRHVVRRISCSVRHISRRDRQAARPGNCAAGSGPGYGYGFAVRTAPRWRDRAHRARRHRRRRRAGSGAGHRR